MTIDPGTSSVVASSSCFVELLLDIFWAVFTGFSRFLVVVCERSFFMPLQEFVVHFKTGKNLWLTLKNAFVRFWLFKRRQTCLVFFRDASLVLLGKNCRLAFFPRLCHFVFSSIRFLVILSVKCFLKFSKNLNLNSIQTFIFVNLLISKVMFFAARVAFCFTITTIFARDPSQQYPSMHKCNSTLNNIHGKFTKF